MLKVSIKWEENDDKGIFEELVREIKSILDRRGLFYKEYTFNRGDKIVKVFTRIKKYGRK